MAVLGSRRLQALAAAVVALLTFVPPSPADASRAELGWQVLDALGRSGASQIAAQVTIEGAGQVVELRSGQPMLPASTQKIYTAGAALLELGPGARLRTEVRATATPAGGVVAGDIVLVGSGDPSLAADDLLRLAGGVRAAGVTTVTGNLLVDDTLFDRVRSGPNWVAGYVGRQSAPLSAVAVDGNRYRRDGSFLSDPATAGGEVFRMALGIAGVTVGGRVLVAQPLAPTVALAVHRSAPMRELIRPALKHSDNFTSEQLFKLLGTRAGGGSHDGAMAALARVTHRLGMPRGGGVDGSGLSRWNSATAAHEATWLWRLRDTAVGGYFKAAMSVACHDGTLRGRMCGTPASGRVFAKTGTLNGVITLAGYTTTADGRDVAFSILLNGAPNPSRARAAIDRAVVAIASARL